MITTTPKCPTCGSYEGASPDPTVPCGGCLMVGQIYAALRKVSELSGAIRRATSRPGNAAQAAQLADALAGEADFVAATAEKLEDWEAATTQADGFRE